MSVLSSRRQRARADGHGKRLACVPLKLVALVCYVLGCAPRSLLFASRGTVGGCAKVGQFCSAAIPAISGGRSARERAHVSTQSGNMEPTNNETHYALNDGVRGLAFRGLSVEDTFTKIYKNGMWGQGSGHGSSPENCGAWIELVREFIHAHKIQSVVDLGCGDWQHSWFIYHDLDVKYTGYDVVRSVVEANQEEWGDGGFHSSALNGNFTFIHSDFSAHVQDLVDADLYIIKDVLMHWSSEKIRVFLKEILAKKKRVKHILLCNCIEPEDWPDDDIGTGGWRPLFSSRPPLTEFRPEVLLQFEGNNKKEVCILRAE